jgi:predicted aldo/keto reductase-like oxidoreductase
MKGLGIIEFIEKIKREKKARHVGFSFHGNHGDFIKIADDYDWDFVQVQYNILDVNFQAGIKGIRHAASKGMGVIVMEPLRGGSLVGRLPEEVAEIYENAQDKKSAADWALSWIYNNPDVTLVLSGMNELEQIEENTRIADRAKPNGMSEAELDTVGRVRSKYLELMKVGCTGCGYCMPCPAGINIPDTFKYYNSYHMFKHGRSRMDYIQFAGVKTDDGKPHWTTSCIDCGKCEKACPQGIKVRREFVNVRKDMEGVRSKVIAAVMRPLMGGKR